MIEKIINCYDSHTHFWATGQVAEGLKLNHLKSADEIKNIEIKKNHYRSEWIVGFGWDQHTWQQFQKSEFPNKKILDETFGNTPVFFSRVDGHASWINSAAIAELKKAGYNFAQDPKGGLIQRNSSGEPTGILFNQAHINALTQLPDFSGAQHQSFFNTSQSIFNRAGFTHVRDLSMNLFFWQQLKQMEDNKSLTLALDSFITVEKLNDLDLVLNEIAIIKKEKSQQIRLHGVKIFIDGSLGSKTAYLSQNYLNSDSNGILIWSFTEIKELIKRSWLAGQQVAIHTIGDQAVHTAVMAAREVSAEGISGRLHLEHVQILKHETILMMKPLHVVCYLQPCHWLSDKSWLREVIPPELVNNLFQWELLRKNKIPFYFGSDSPIENPSLVNNRLAINESAKWGIPELNADWKFYHSHPDTQWMNGITEIENDKIKQVFFNGHALL